MCMIDVFCLKLNHEHIHAKDGAYTSENKLFLGHVIVKFINASFFLYMHAHFKCRLKQKSSLPVPGK